MSKVKYLPAWAHAKIRRIDKTHGAQDPFREAAKLHHQTFKNLVKRGAANAEIVDRVIKTLESDMEANEKTGAEILTHVESRRQDILSTIAISPKSAKMPRMLAVFIMRKDAGMNRRSTAETVGYSSFTSVKEAEKCIYDEMDTNRAFVKLVYEIKGELGY